MANEEHVEILRQGADVWNEWRRKNIELIPDLYRANLSGANLSGANLFDADVRFADFSDVNLSGANLSSARNLTQDQLWETIYDNDTKLPEGVERETGR